MSKDNTYYNQSEQQKNSCENSYEFVQNKLYEIHEFAGFVSNEQKKVVKGELKKIFENFPNALNYVSSLIKKIEELEKNFEYKEFEFNKVFDENISLGELLDEYKMQLGKLEKEIVQAKWIEKKNRELKTSYDMLKSKYEEFKDTVNSYLEENKAKEKDYEEKILEWKNKYNSLNNAVKNNEKLARRVANSMELKILKEESKKKDDEIDNLKRGNRRLPIDTIRLIARLHQEGYSIEQIMKYAKVGRTSVYKYKDYQ